MHLKIHAAFPGSEFSINSSLNLVPVSIILNKLFRRVVNTQVETMSALTLKQARELGLFERAWLPDILPPSTHHITLIHNHPLNCAQGEFSFSPADWQDFSSQLRPEQRMDAPFVNWAKSLRKMQGQGHTLWHYPAFDRHWVFFCKADAGYCEYVMWINVVE
jgi:hypothetical protein